MWRVFILPVLLWAILGVIGGCAVFERNFGGEKQKPQHKTRAEQYQRTAGPSLPTVARQKKEDLGNVFDQQCDPEIMPAPKGCEQ